MGDNSKIEWTDATWNPIVGCSLVSPGCTACYAMKVAARLAAISSTKHYLGTVETVKGRPIWTGLVNAAPDAIWYRPLKWTRPRRIFVNSMGDLFHEAIPDHLIDRAFAVMACAPQHIFQVLTKRPERMRQYIHHSRIPYIAAATRSLFEHRVSKVHGLANWPLSNVWLGVSAEDQKRWDERIECLGATPAAVRFVSAEPLLGPIDCGNAFDPPVGDKYQPINWVIVGGESGPDARPMHPNWARSLRDQCAAAGVPYFFKQHGEWIEIDGPQCRNVRSDRTPFDYWFTEDHQLLPWASNRGRYSAYATSIIRQVGKKAAGRILDGRTHDEYPR